MDQAEINNWARIAVDLEVAGEVDNVLYVVALMRKEMKSSSFRMWRKRVSGRKTKHAVTNPSYRFKAHCHK